MDENQDQNRKPPESSEGEVKMQKPRVQPPPGFGSSGGGAPPPYEYQHQKQAEAAEKKRKSFFGGLLLISVLIVLFIGGGLVVTAIFGGGSGGASGFGAGGFAKGDRIGVVRIEGTIMPGETYEHWMKTIRELGDDQRVKGLIVRIDSPGGAVGTTQEIYEALGKIKRERGIPIYASMGNVSASGGYYVAAVCDQIFALKGTLTGSIGTIFEVTNFSELSDKIGIEIEYIKSGRFKDSGSPFRDMNENEKYIFQLAIEDSYDQFVDDIVVHREQQLLDAAENLSDADWEKYLFAQSATSEITAESFLRQVGDGRVYTGQQAEQLGLVDQLGTLDDAINSMRALPGMGYGTTIYEIPRKPTLKDLLGAKMQSLFSLSARYPMLKYQLTMP